MNVWKQIGDWRHFFHTKTNKNQHKKANLKGLLLGDWQILWIRATHFFLMTKYSHFFLNSTSNADHYLVWSANCRFQKNLVHFFTERRQQLHCCKNCVCCVSVPFAYLFANLRHLADTMSPSLLSISHLEINLLSLWDKGLLLLQLVARCTRRQLSCHHHQKGTVSCASLSLFCICFRSPAESHAAAVVVLVLHLAWKKPKRIASRKSPAHAHLITIQRSPPPAAAAAEQFSAELTLCSSHCAAQLSAPPRSATLVCVRRAFVPGKRKL